MQYGVIISTTAFAGEGCAGLYAMHCAIHPGRLVAAILMVCHAPATHE